MEVENKPQPMAGFAVGILSPGKRTDQVKRKPEQAQAPSEKIPKLDLGQVWFGESSQSAARWEQRAEDGSIIGQELPPPPLTRRLTPMSELLNSLLEAENSSPAQDKRSSEATIAEETSPPTLKRNLTPMSNLLESLLKDTPTKERGEGPVFFPVEVDTEKLLDWKEKLSENPVEDKNLRSPTKKEGEEQNNNEMEKAALVKVNNTDIALFKYGEKIIATSSKCPHAGGPLHLGDIEMLPDRSLCVRCPWHKWAFCIASDPGQSEDLDDMENSKVGSCVFPAGRSKTLQVFSTEVSQNNRRHIKIGFESIPIATLVNEPF